MKLREFPGKAGVLRRALRISHHNKVKKPPRFEKKRGGLPYYKGIAFK